MRPLLSVFFFSYLEQLERGRIKKNLNYGKTLPPDEEIRTSYPRLLNNILHTLSDQMRSILDSVPAKESSSMKIRESWERVKLLLRRELDSEAKISLSEAFLIAETTRGLQPLVLRPVPAALQGMQVYS